MKEKKLLTASEFKKLEPFLYRKASKQRIILYLIALGYKVSDLVQLKVHELKNININEELNASRDELLYNRTENEFVFVTSDGKKMAYTSYYRLFRYAGEKIIGRRMSQEEIYNYIHSLTS